MPTELPPRRAAESSEQAEVSEAERDDGMQIVVPILIIAMLLMANIALYSDRYGMPTASTAGASSSARPPTP